MNPIKAAKIEYFLTVSAPYNLLKQFLVSYSGHLLFEVEKIDIIIQDKILANGPLNLDMKIDLDKIPAQIIRIISISSIVERNDPTLTDKFILEWDQDTQNLINEACSQILVELINPRLPEFKDD